MGSDIDFGPASQLPKPRRAKALPLPEALRSSGDADVLNRLWEIIEARRNADPEVSHSARLISRGSARVAQKFGEEAVECLIESISGSRPGLISESADVLYHLLVMWVTADVQPEEVWREL